jgi:hypothetical protein
MKLRLLLCGAALMVAGCASQQNPFNSAAEQSYINDLVPQPVPGLSPAEVERIYQVNAPVSVSGALSQNLSQN